jgi:hypothetical protein
MCVRKAFVTVVFRSTGDGSGGRTKITMRHNFVVHYGIRRGQRRPHQARGVLRRQDPDGRR